MAGLGRIQQRFNAAVVTLLALAGFRGLAGKKDAKDAAASGHGHPIHAKYLRTQNVMKATGRDRVALPAHFRGTSANGYRRPGVNLLPVGESTKPGARVLQFGTFWNRVDRALDVE